MTPANRPVRTAVFQILFWINAIGCSAAILRTAGLPLMDLKTLAADEPLSWQVAGAAQLGAAGPGTAPQLTLLEDRNIRSAYRCDLPGLTSTTCVPAGAPLPEGRARIDYVDMPASAGSPAHRMPTRIVVGNELVYRRPYDEAISAARNRCLLVAAMGVALWLAINLGLTALWKRGLRAAT